MEEGAWIEVRQRKRINLPAAASVSPARWPFLMGQVASGAGWSTHSGALATMVLNHHCAVGCLTTIFLLAVARRTAVKSMMKNS